MNLFELLNEKWSKDYKKSINCSNPKGFSQKAHCAGRKARQSGKKTKSSSINEGKLTLLDALRAFLPMAMEHLGIDKLPKIKLRKDLKTHHMPSFGQFSNDENIIQVDIDRRNPNDILRTLAHELTHYWQNTQGMLGQQSWRTGSPDEDQANSEAGVIMRKFNQAHPEFMRLDPVVLEDFSNKKNLTEAFDAPYSLTWEHNPGESHDAWTKLPDGTTLSIMVSRDYGVTPDPDDWAVEFYRDNTQEVTGQGDAQRIFATVLAAIKEVIELEQPLSISFAASKETDTGDENLSRANLYTKLVQRYATHWGYNVKVSDLRGTTAYRLDKITNENFADGQVKGKSRPGRVKRAGASCKGSVTNLRAKAKKYGGEKGKMYHWCANMKGGKK